MTALDTGCRQARSVRDAWIVDRVPTLAVGEAVLVGDALSGGVDDTRDGIRDLGHGEGESGEAGRAVSELALGEPSIVGGLESVSLGVHEDLNARDRVFGGSHAAKHSDCDACCAVRFVRDEFLAVAS